MFKKEILKFISRGCGKSGAQNKDFLLSHLISILKGDLDDIFEDFTEEKMKKADPKCMLDMYGIKKESEEYTDLRVIDDKIGWIDDDRKTLHTY